MTAYEHRRYETQEAFERGVGRMFLDGWWPWEPVANAGAWEVKFEPVKSVLQRIWSQGEAVGKARPAPAAPLPTFDVTALEMAIELGELAIQGELSKREFYRQVAPLRPRKRVRDTA